MRQLIPILTLIIMFL